MTVKSSVGARILDRPPGFHGVSGRRKIRAGTSALAQDFKGGAFPSHSLPLLPRSSAMTAKAKPNVAGTTGDLPALTLAARAEGLTIVTYVSDCRTDPVSGLGEVLPNISTTRAWLRSPPATTPAGCRATRIRELYTRCAKTLLAVGDASGEKDRATGMRLELVASENPATLSSGAEDRLYPAMGSGAVRRTRRSPFFRRTEDGGDAARIVTPDRRETATQASPSPPRA